MNSPRPLRTTIYGYRISPPAERAGFEMLSAFATTIAVSRATNYVRERRRPAPLLRSMLRRAYHAPGGNQMRVHHFLPGIGIAFAAGAASILTRRDRRDLWLSLPFGAGAALTLDEADLLLELDNPYWGSQLLALAEGSLAAAGSAVLALRFHRRGSTMAAPSTTGPPSGSDERRSPTVEEVPDKDPDGKTSDRTLPPALDERSKANARTT
jgi:hypothetical protein